MTNGTALAYNSDNFNLDNWNIALPVDSKGGTTGLAVTISDLTNFTSPYFYSNADGSMTFMAPVSGATTASSYGARAELRELNADGSLARWTLAQGGTMTATLAVNDVPTFITGQPGKIIIGQIHGKSNELVRLYYENGTVYFKNDRSGGTNTEHKFTLTDAEGKQPSISLNEKFSYMIDAHGSTLTVKVYADGKVYSSVTTINSYWQTDTLYFKAGVYLGVTATPGVDVGQGTGLGQTTFYGLDMSHAAGQGLGGLQAPVAAADSFAGEKDHLVTGNLLADNGHGADAGPQGLSLSVAAGTVTTAAGGTVVVTADGSFTYTPKAGFTGADSFTYTLKDGAGLTSAGTATVTVNAPPPVVAPPVTEPPVTLPPSVLTLNGTAGNDKIDADKKTGTVINGLGGNDYLIGHDGGDTLYGGEGNDTLYGYWGDDVIDGGAGSDLVNGSVGHDTLAGGAGADKLTGGTGADVFVFRAADVGAMDTVTDFSAAEGDRIDLTEVLAGLYTKEGTLGSFVKIVTSGTHSILSVDTSGTGTAWTALADFTGVTGMDVQKMAAAGTLIVPVPATPSTPEAPAPVSTRPVLEGTAAADKLDADHKTGTLVKGLGGNDYLIGHDGDDELNGGDGSDKLYSYWGNDTLLGGAGADILDAGPGDDVLNGGVGKDTMTGGAGADAFVFDALDGNVDVVTDFRPAEGDKINLHDILHIANPAGVVLSDYVSLKVVGGNTLVSVDADGKGAASGSATVAQLSGVTGLDADDLFAHGAIIV